MDAAVVVWAMMVNAGIVVELDTALAVVDTGLALLVGLDTTVVMVEVAVTVLVVSDTHPDCETMEGGARIAITIPGMLSVRVLVNNESYQIGVR